MLFSSEDLAWAGVVGGFVPPTPQYAWPLLARRVGAEVWVKHDEAMRVLFACTHNVPEPTGALALAGLLAGRSQAAGKRVAVIQTGGNADEDQLIKVLSWAPPPCEGDRT